MKVLLAQNASPSAFPHPLKQSCVNIRFFSTQADFCLYRIYYITLKYACQRFLYNFLDKYIIFLPIFRTHLHFHDIPRLFFARLFHFPPLNVFLTTATPFGEALSFSFPPTRRPILPFTRLRQLCLLLPFHLQHVLLSISNLSSPPRLSLPSSTYSFFSPHTHSLLPLPVFRLSSPVPFTLPIPSVFFFCTYRKPTLSCHYSNPLSTIFSLLPLAHTVCVALYISHATTSVSFPQCYAKHN